MKLNKRGKLLLDNVAGGIIGLVILIGLVYLGYLIIGSLINQEDKDAGNFIDGLIEKIDGLENVKNAQLDLQGFSNERWGLIGWSRGQTAQEGKPDKCFDKSCICVCPEDSSTTSPGFFGSTVQGKSYEDFILERGSLLAKTCQSKGICREIKKESVYLKTEFPKENDPSFYPPEGNYMPLPVKKSLFSIKVDKGDNFIFLSYNLPEKEDRARY